VGSTLQTVVNFRDIVDIYPSADIGKR